MNKRGIFMPVLAILTVTLFVYMIFTLNGQMTLFIAVNMSGKRIVTL